LRQDQKISGLRFKPFNPLEASSHETMEQTELHKTRITRYQLFLTFSWITLSGFGGVMFWARRGWSNESAGSQNSSLSNC